MEGGGTLLWCAKLQFGLENIGFFVIFAVFDHFGPFSPILVVFWCILVFLGVFLSFFGVKKCHTGQKNG